MNKQERSWVYLFIFFFIAFMFVLGVMDEAAHAQGSESPALAKARDDIHIKRCVDTNAPAPKYPVCRALMRGANQAEVSRRWVSSHDLRILLFKESSFNYLAVNPEPCAAGGHARGLFQFCDRTWAGVGCAKKYWRSATYQAMCGFWYIKARYGTPAKALAFHHRTGWY